MISPSLVGPGSTEVLEPNLRHEPGLTHARTDSQHVRGPSPPLVGFLQLHFRRGANTWGLPAPFLGHWLCLVSGLSAHYGHVRDVNLIEILGAHG